MPSCWKVEEERRAGFGVKVGVVEVDVSLLSILLLSENGLIRNSRRANNGHPDCIVLVVAARGERVVYS